MLVLLYMYTFEKNIFTCDTVILHSGIATTPK